MTGKESLLLSTAYLAPVEYYMVMNRAGSVLIEQCEHFIKQSYRNRCRIAAANGVQTLSIPVEKPSPGCSIRDIRIAEHGNWRHLHWNALVSAYNSTPFFDYYADDFRPFYEKRYDFLFDFNEQLRQLVCSLTGVEVNVGFTTSYARPDGEERSDLREKIHPKRPPVVPEFRPYYQVFERRLGFLPNLSIVDLLFNMGPESEIWLTR